MQVSDGPQLGTLYQHYFPDRMPLAAHSIYFQVLGEHGFIGLFLYLIILAAAFLRCSRIISVTVRRSGATFGPRSSYRDHRRACSVFCVAGAALSMAYYDLFIIDVALLLPLREIVLLRGKRKHRAWSPPRACLFRNRLDYVWLGGAATALPAGLWRWPCLNAPGCGAAYLIGVIPPLQMRQPQNVRPVARQAAETKNQPARAYSNQFGI